MPNKRIWTSTDNLAGHKNKATMFWTAVAEHNKVQRDVISKCKHQQNVLFPRSVLSNCFKQRSFLSLDLCSKDRRRCCRVTVVKFWLELREDKGDQNIPALYIYIYMYMSSTTYFLSSRTHTSAFAWRYNKKAFCSSSSECGVLGNNGLCT